MTKNDCVKSNSTGYCLQISASLHNELSERSIFVMNKMKIKLVGNISRISLK